MGQILLQQIETPNGLYCYDANTNHIFQVSEEDYKTIGKIVNKEIVWDESLNRYRNLGLMRPVEIEKMEHPETNRIEYYLKRHINQITLQLTQNCNLRCAYCAYTNIENSTQRNHSLKKMSLDTAKRSIDFFVKHSGDSKKVSIGLYGGEPLIEFELLKEIVEYAESQFVGKEVGFSMTTNGTLLSPAIYKYLVNHNVSIVVSIDGPKAIHDKNRVNINGEGSFEIIENNLREIYKECGDDMFQKLSINMVVDPMNNLDQILELFDEDLWKDIQMRYSIVDDVYNDMETKFSEEFIKRYRYQYFLMLLKAKNIIDGIECSKFYMGEEIRLENDYESFHKKIEKIPTTWAPSGPCIPGKRRMFIDVDGNFFPCERVSETSEIMKIGSLEEGLFYDKIKKIVNISKVTEEECKNCVAMNKCSICARLVDDHGTFSAKQKLKHCDMVKGDLKRALKEVLFSKEMKDYL